MRIYCAILLFVFTGILLSCSSSKKTGKMNVLSAPKKTETAQAAQVEANEREPGKIINTVSSVQLLNIDRKEFVNYAKQYLGVPYLYASADPAKGFDCSGLLFHVFQHFNVKSPRSSYNYENFGEDVDLAKARPGDLILFTTDSDTTRIGHIGIITETKPKLAFLHASTSRGVIMSDLTGYYLQHFVKVIRVLR